MMDALLISNLLLWVVVAALGFIVYALTRQIGVLHERIAPAGALALSRGPEVGEAAPPLTTHSISGVPISIGGIEQEGRQTLLFFLSPNCPVCKTLIPTLQRIIREESPGLRALFASDGEPDEHRSLLETHQIDPDAYLLSTDVGVAFAVAKLPYAVLIDAEGTIRAKGIVNTREHLESLFEAERLGVGSVQAYLEGRPRPSTGANPDVDRPGEGLLS